MLTATAMSEKHLDESPNGRASKGSTPMLSTAAAEVQTLLSRMHQDEPFLPTTEAVLRCHAKRRLYRSFLQAGSSIIANWLFSSPDQPFHSNVSTTPSFAAALAVRAEWKCTPCTNPLFTSDTPDAPQQLQVPGRDILFVPVAIVAGQRLVGYTFGAGIAPDVAKLPCPFGKQGSVFLPHAVGRFSYDYKVKDLLIVAHGLSNGATGIMHFRNGGDDEELDDHHRSPGGGLYSVDAGTRQRIWYVVPGASYGHRRLPGRVLAMIHLPEYSIPSSPTYQFDTPPDPSSSELSKLTLNDYMASLERLVKGRYKCDKACKDGMDYKSGQVINRVTYASDTDFDVDSAIAVNVFKDLAVRNFFSYMSATSNMSFLPVTAQQ